MTGREAAEKLGVTRRTICKYVAEPREEFLARASARRLRAATLSLQGLTRREIAEEMGASREAVKRLLRDARRAGEWAAACEEHATAQD
ncbi:helix-turn-helix domain-containing protein [Pseudonocardia sp. Ae168_Ps1]|uniref:helix-turn-helix domain-containing protein n=1 Tax=unclassified Pseudonocardia TaxID=2619320 RepID=UPI00352A57F2